MRGTRSIATLLACTAVLSLGGCTPQQQEGMKAEFVRETYHTPIGVVYVASVIGSGVPNGGPSPLHAVSTDLTWRSLLGSHFEMSGLAPSPFDVVDPNRPGQFRKINETTTEIIIK
jgi:hypothetical protein